MAFATSTMAIMTIVTTLISTAMAMRNAQQQGKFQSTVARNNAILAERAAKDAEERGKIAERAKRDQTRGLIGRQRAALAGSGQVVDEGSALDITTNTAEIGEQDALTVRNNYAREAAGARAQGMNYEARARLATLNANQASASSLFEGATSVASKWYSFGKAGAFDGPSGFGQG